MLPEMFPSFHPGCAPFPNPPQGREQLGTSWEWLGTGCRDLPSLLAICPWQTLSAPGLLPPNQRSGGEGGPERVSGLLELTQPGSVGVGSALAPDAPGSGFFF